MPPEFRLFDSVLSGSHNRRPFNTVTTVTRPSLVTPRETLISCHARIGVS